jgi:basic amino acid/polyamine antiporter, APA family
MESGTTATTSRLQGVLRGRHFFTLGVGTVIGVGWAIMLGEWVSTAAPLGAVAGFIIGAILMLPIAACYAELTSVMPAAGADVVYARVVFGPRIAFAVGWFLVLMATGITSFEAISLAWFLDKLFPNLQGDIAYSILGHDVREGALAIGIGVLLLITLINLWGARSVGRFQDLFTYLKIFAVLAFLAAAFAVGTPSNLQPAWKPLGERPLLVGVLWIAATAPVWYGGFQVVPQAIEERSPATSVRTVGIMTMMPVFVGAAFFCLVIIACCLVTPWEGLPGAPLPAAFAIESAFEQTVWAKLVLVSIVLGILATWNACFLWATRLLLALARERLVPQMFAQTNRFDAPGRAALFVGGVSLVGVLLGRGAIVPIINMASISLSFSYFVCCWALLRLRRLEPDATRAFRVPLGIIGIRFATVAAAAMALVSFLEPLTRGRGVPLEWLLLCAWATLATLFYRATQRAAVVAPSS